MCLTYMNSLSNLNTNSLALDMTNHPYSKQMDSNLKKNSENVLSILSKPVASYSNKKKSISTASQFSSAHTLSPNNQKEISTSPFATEKDLFDSANSTSLKLSEKQQQSSNDFCKYCVNELTLFQIDFDEAIQFCTNINCFQYKEKLHEFDLQMCLIKRNYKDVAAETSLTKIEHDHKLKESQINQLISHIAETEISQENAAVASSIAVDKSFNTFSDQVKDTIYEKNENKESDILFEEFNFGQSIQEYETGNTITINNNSTTNDNNTTLDNQIDDFFLVSHQQPYETVTMNQTSTTHLENQIQMFNTSNEDLTQTAQFQSVMNGLNENDFNLDDDLFSDLLFSDAASETHYMNNTQVFVNANTFDSTNINNNDETLTYTNLDEFKSLVSQSQNETIFLDGSVCENTKPQQAQTAPALASMCAASNAPLLSENMPTFDANGNLIVSHARAKSSKSSILITKIKEKPVKTQVEPTSSNQAKLKLIDDKEQILGLVNTVKSENGLTKKRKYDDLMQTQSMIESKSEKSLLPWEKKVKESNKHKKSPNYNTEYSDTLETKSKNSFSSPSYSSSLTEPKTVSRFGQDNIITKADLSKKASSQKLNFQERGSDLKRALMGDSSFLSTINNSPNSSNVTEKPKNSYKDLVLNVLKKSHAT